MSLVPASSSGTSTSSGGGTDFRITARAYCKMVLHALKYPHAFVFGLLVADKKRLPTGSGSEPPSTVRLVDAVPIGHQTASLSVAVEAALCQIDSHCHSQPPPRVIAGVYYANETLKDASLNQFACRVAQKVQSYFPDAVLINLDNCAMGIDSDVPCHRQVYCYSAESKSWKAKPKEKCLLENEENVFGITSIAIQTKLYRELIDFDNHLDHPSLDYWNRQLNSKLDSLL